MTTTRTSPQTGRNPTVAPLALSTNKCMILMGGGPLGTSLTVDALIGRAVQAAFDRKSDPSAQIKAVVVLTAKATNSAYYQGLSRAVTCLEATHGCVVEELHPFRAVPNRKAAAATLRSADLIFFLGGDTQEAVRLLAASGLDEVLLEVAAAGVPIYGHSAGQICWFSRSFSDTQFYTTPDKEPWEYEMIDGMPDGFDIAICPHASDVAAERTNNTVKYPNKITRRGAFKAALKADALIHKRNGIAVDGDTAIFLFGDVAFVLGTGTVSLYTWEGGEINERHLKTGDSFRISELEAVDAA